MRHCVSLLSARVIPGHQLADHSVDRRMILLCFMAPVTGTGGAFGAWLLLKSIAIATNAFWFGRLSAPEVEITDAAVGLAIVAIPVIGSQIDRQSTRLNSSP